jgi:outer membrane lipoprotein-sorting protein
MDYVKRYIPIISLVLLLLALVACGGDDGSESSEGSESSGSDQESSAPDSEPEEELSGNELITKMEEAVKAIDKAHWTTEFQMATSDGGVNGTIESWGTRASNTRTQFTSETAELNGMIIGSNENESWVYSADQDTVYIFAGLPGTPNLVSQPEVDQAFWYATTLWEDGFDDTEASIVGSEEVNGHQTHEVEVTYKESSNENISLDGLTTTYWIDKESYLPQKAEMSLKLGDITAKGTVALQGEKATDEAMDASLFTYQPAEGTNVVNFADGEEISIEDITEGLGIEGIPELEEEPSELSTE